MKTTDGVAKCLKWRFSGAEKHFSEIMASALDAEITALPVNRRARHERAACRHNFARTLIVVVVPRLKYRRCLNEAEDVCRVFR